VNTEYQNFNSSYGDTMNGDAPHPMALLLEEMGDLVEQPQTGQVRNGIVMEVGNNEILVDIGSKSEGIVNGRELERIGDEFGTLEVGAEVPVFVLREDRDGNVLLSIARAQAEKDWERAEGLLESQSIFDGSVAGYNRGGVIVKLGQVRGFVPASQLSNTTQAIQDREADPEERWSSLVGCELMLKVIDLDRRRNRLILSERLAMREWRKHQKETLLASLSEGDKVEGLVSSLADFGAFVDIGGADGLVHLSELSWSRVRHPSEVVSIGDKIEVQVLNVDRERRRIGLSLRRLQPKPWDTVGDKYAVGQVVRGTITKLVNFGAFARLNDDPIEGLIHISELADRRVGHPKEIVSEGEEHDLRIIRIDVARRRIGLSLKQALPEIPEPEIDWTVVPLEENPEISVEETVAESAVEEMVVAAPQEELEPVLA